MYPATYLLRSLQGSLVLEGASMCLLSKCIPSALKGGKSFLNAGAQSCSARAPPLRGALKASYKAADGAAL